MHEIESPAFDFGAAKRRAQPSLASVFEQFHERWLSASERFDPSPKNLARIASLRAAEYRAEAL